MEEEDIIDNPQDIESEEIIPELEIHTKIESDSDNDEIEESSDQTIENNIIKNIEDINVFNQNYEKIKENNKTSKTISKYEKTKILSKRCEQLENGCIPLIKDYERFDNIYDIAFEELEQNKIPFILKRFLNNKYEYWKLEDLIN